MFCSTRESEPRTLEQKKKPDRRRALLVMVGRLVYPKDFVGNVESVTFVRVIAISARLTCFLHSPTKIDEVMVDGYSIEPDQLTSGLRHFLSWLLGCGGTLAELIDYRPRVIPGFIARDPVNQGVVFFDPHISRE